MLECRAVDVHKTHTYNLPTQCLYKKKRIYKAPSSSAIILVI